MQPEELAMLGAGPSRDVEAGQLPGALRDPPPVAGRGALRAAEVRVAVGAVLAALGLRRVGRKRA